VASTTAVTSLDAKASGSGVTVDFTAAKRNVTMVFAPSVSTTGGVVGVEASHDGVVWVPMASFAAESGRVRSYDNTVGAYRYWRAVVVDAIRGGGSVTATFMEAD